MRILDLEIYCAVHFSPLQGSGPAGGCLMSMTCDSRIMADVPHYSIGLNETQLGIVAPFWSGTVNDNNSELWDCS